MQMPIWKDDSESGRWGRDCRSWGECVQGLCCLGTIEGVTWVWNGGVDLRKAENRRGQIN